MASRIGLESLIPGIRSLFKCFPIVKYGSSPNKISRQQMKRNHDVRLESLLVSNRHIFIWNPSDVLFPRSPGAAFGHTNPPRQYRKDACAMGTYHGTCWRAAVRPEYDLQRGTSCRDLGNLPWDLMGTEMIPPAALEWALKCNAIAVPRWDLMQTSCRAE